MMGDPSIFFSVGVKSLRALVLDCTIVLCHDPSYFIVIVRSQASAATTAAFSFILYSAYAEVSCKKRSLVTSAGCF